MKRLLIILICLLLQPIYAQQELEQRDDEDDEAYLKRIHRVYWPEEDAPNEEDGLVYTVAQTLNQFKNFLAGYQVGFYHDNKKTVSHKCMGVEMTE